MEMRLKRIADFNEGGTLGFWIIGEWSCWTLECPWRGNQRNVSCVPEGLYGLVPHDGPKYVGTFGLVNHSLGVSHYETIGIERYACVLHSARLAAYLKGCIALGLSLYLDSGTPALASRKAALSHVTGFLERDERHELRIENCLGGFPM